MNTSRNDRQRAIDGAIAKSKAIGLLPIAIWDQTTADKWHASPREVQLAWNDYAQSEADKEFAENGPYYAPALYHEWKPPMTFDQWMLATSSSCLLDKSEA